jgi:hypothetical protein
LVNNLQESGRTRDFPEVRRKGPGEE